MEVRKGVGKQGRGEERECEGIKIRCVAHYLAAAMKPWGVPNGYLSLDAQCNSK